MTQYVSSTNLIPACIPRTAEDGLPFSEWDGSTLDPGHGPSKSSNTTITVYGEGSDYCIRLNREQVRELFWRPGSFNFSVKMPQRGLGLSGSISAHYSCGHGHVGDPPPTTGDITLQVPSIEFPGEFKACVAECDVTQNCPYNESSAYCDNDAHIYCYRVGWYDEEPCPDNGWRCLGEGFNVGQKLSDAYYYRNFRENRLVCDTSPVWYFVKELGVWISSRYILYRYFDLNLFGYGRGYGNGGYQIIDSQSDGSILFSNASSLASGLDYSQGVFVATMNATDSLCKYQNCAGICWSMFNTNFGAIVGVGWDDEYQNYSLWYSLYQPKSNDGSGYPLVSFRPNLNYTSFIQTDEDEFWWNPGIAENYSLSFYFGQAYGGGVTPTDKVIYACKAARGYPVYPFDYGTGKYTSTTPDHYVAPNRFGDESSMPGTDYYGNDYFYDATTTSIPIEYTFMDGSVVNGSQFYVYKSRPNVSISGPNEYYPNGSISFDPTGLIPEKISIKAYQYFPYGGAYDEDTGNLSS